MTLWVLNVTKAGLVLLMILLVLPQLEGAEDNFQVINDKKLRTIRYIPNEPSGEALILVHGFSRNAKRMAGHASALASEGVTVWTPNLYSLMGGARSRAKNVEFLLGLTRELSRTHKKVSLAGHSAGGALVFSATIRAQQQGIEVAQLVLLDAVPWKETIKEAGQLRPLPLLSLTAESSAMNANLKVDELHAAIEFPITHLRLVGSSHVDSENPPGFFAKSLTTETGQRLFAELLRRYVLHEGFEAYVSEQEEMGFISRKQVGIKAQ
ncbi:MAG: alpha/beta fold hydrolase [Lysobacterales bacterium]